MNQTVIVGAGAMGCLFAARLAEQGVQVTLVDVDQARLALLDRDGILLADDSGERRVQVRACLAAQATAPVDLVILFTKGMHSAAAIRSVAQLADGRALALTLQNGIGNAEAIAEVFAPDRILLGVTDFPADLEGPTRVASHGCGHVVLGGFTREAGVHSTQVVALLNRGGLNARATTDPQVELWEKVAFNAALNATAAVTGLTVGGLDAAPGRRIALAIVGEVVVTAHAREIAIDRERIESKIAFALASHRGHKPSMLQDRLAGRPTEIETINGAIAAAAEVVGVETPVTAILADLVRLIERPGTR